MFKPLFDMSPCVLMHERFAVESNSMEGSVAIVGAAGFIGSALTTRLVEKGIPVIAIVRQPGGIGRSVQTRAVGDFNALTDWAPLFSGVGTVVHLAGRAHASTKVLDSTFIREQATMARRIAEGASRSNVGRIVLISSIKVMGESTAGSPFRADQQPTPRDVYGVAKLRIEEAVAAATGHGLAFAIVRPPLVYGAGVKGNFQRLIRLVDSGVPLPLASIDNRRSLVGLQNLLDLLELVLDSPAAAGRTFHLRDEEEVSTPELLRRLARHLRRRSLLIPCPPSLLRLFARSIGYGEAAERLVGSLQVDDQATRDVLRWRPRVTLDEGLAETCLWYRSRGPVALNQEA